MELTEIDAFVYSRAQSSGYIDFRASISLVAMVKNDTKLEFQPIIDQCISTGNIYKLIQNENNYNEIILACHLGVFYLDIRFRKIPLMTQPVTYRIECEFYLKEERHLVGHRISQIVQLKNQLIVAVWEKPHFYKITRSNSSSIPEKIAAVHLESFGSYFCSDLKLLRAPQPDLLKP